MHFCLGGGKRAAQAAVGVMVRLVNQTSGVLCVFPKSGDTNTLRTAG